MKTGGVIIGAGAIGSAVAYALAQAGASGLQVLDADLEGVLSSTERNAGGVRHLWQQPCNVSLAKQSIAFFKENAQQVGYQDCGYLWLCDARKAPLAREASHQAVRQGAHYEEWSVERLRERHPFLDKSGDLEMAVFGSDDGLVNANAVKGLCRSRAKEHGAQFLDRTWVVGLEKNGAGWRVLTHVFPTQEAAHAQLAAPDTHLQPTGSLDAEYVVLCGGAWTQTLLRQAGVAPQIQPFRRQIVYFKSEVPANALGMIVDTSGVYFHPEGGNLLAGFVIKDEASSWDTHGDTDFFESHIWPALYERSTYFERLKPLSTWGGLYSYTPDTTGILGPVPGMEGVFEAHSFTGRGLMQSYGAAQALAERIVQGKNSFPEMTRARFEQEKSLLPEQLHI